MSILINTILKRVEKEFQLPDVMWEDKVLTKNDYDFLQDECCKDSEFDPTNKRREMLDQFILGNFVMIVRECKYGSVFAIFDSLAQVDELPWNLWGRIMRLFYETDKELFKVFFFANRELRKFPEKYEEIRPININGGYTYRCNPQTIVIYRAEDATRVLIHELQHACCLDNPNSDLDTVEAETEAWAELFYIAIISMGRRYIFNDLVKRQSEWMIKQNRKVKKYMYDPDSREFPWRYTIGKQEVWERWKILNRDFMTPYIIVGNSLRLTCPPNKIFKQRFQVSDESIIL